MTPLEKHSVLNNIGKIPKQNNIYAIVDQWCSGWINLT